MSSFTAGRINPSKLECLEAVRGIAAFVVLVGHVLLVFWPVVYFRDRADIRWETLPAWLQQLTRFPLCRLWDGALAVAVFFVLSGFVLSLSFFQRPQSANLGSAVLRRYPRLMFPAGASILFACLLALAGFMFSPQTAQYLNEIQGIPNDTAASQSNNWLASYYNFPAHFPTACRESLSMASRYNPVTWTMPVEFTGSLLVFGFLALFGTLRHRWLVYLLAGGYLLMREQDAIFNVFYLEFMMGVALCDAWVHLRHERLWNLSLPWAWASLALAIFVIPWKPVMAFLIVATVAASPPLQRLLSGPRLAFLGRISFGLYLVHMPITCSIGCGLFLFLSRTCACPFLLASTVAALVSIVASLLAAWIFNRTIDTPTLHLTRWLDKTLCRRQTPANEGVQEEKSTSVPKRLAA